MGRQEKTNVMRTLDRLGVPYREHFYEGDGTLSGTDIARMLGEDPRRAFKTLVTLGKSGGHYVFMIPVSAELDLKKAAAAVHEKALEMLRAKDLLPLTGYVHGGCSPIGMKKQFPTLIHHTARGYETIMFSAGKIGCQVECALEGLQKAVPVSCADLIAARES